MKSREFEEFKELIDKHITEFLPRPKEKDGYPKTLWTAMEYSLLAGGKRIRPVLLLESCRLAGGSVQFALPYAAAAEFIQTYSLIHDDLPAMDNDDYRRGKLTCHKVFGEGMAVLAGDGLLSAAYEVMAEDMLLFSKDAKALERKAKAFAELSYGTGIRGMVLGQAADLEEEGKKADPAKLLFIHEHKTMAFIKSALLAGAYLGGAGEKLIESLASYGEAAGLAFQIADDIQDETGDPKKRGKKVGGDRDLGKATYPALYGLGESKKKALGLIQKAREAISDYDSPILTDLTDFLSDLAR